ncbi:hypothetical protein SOCE26_036290 [Sorangium cellulosum]|uniref:Uncharacterized protein n=1 Tax=Sorangium cellulosum TaxID=56 RepID=A0A2L0ESG9_SORCE|nr:hypothetical protein [Sorangium cellulosum]AUX42202.1 hypothetical protein SOCE26_036290 [Sorangium cellulosum]
MKSEGELGGAARALLDRDEVEGVLSGAFYAPAEAPRSRVRTRAAGAASEPGAAPPEKPQHYKVICISMYTEDLERLDEMVSALKARGMTKANRSALIRHALSQVDLDKIPKGI